MVGRVKHFASNQIRETRHWSGSLVRSHRASRSLEKGTNPQYPGDSWLRLPNLPWGVAATLDHSPHTQI